MVGVPYGAIQDATGTVMEDVQVEPDVVVENDPASLAAGRDLQLERAIAELMATP